MPFTKEDAAEFIKANKSHVERLRRTVTNLVTIKHILYFFDQLEELYSGEPVITDKKHAMQAEAVLTAIVMSYGRLFASSTGTQSLKKRIVPREFCMAHEEIIELRNERYAHHGTHATTKAEIELFVGEFDVGMKLHWRASSYAGAPMHWKELFLWIAQFLKSSFNKQIEHLSLTTGKLWIAFEPEMDLEDISVNDTGELGFPPLTRG